MSSTIDEASETIKGIGNFFNYLKSVIDVIAVIIDLRTLLLFIAVALISMGLSFLGIPKGKISFVLSLLIADLFWFTWIKSFNESMEFAGKFLVMLRSNIILCIPFIIIYFFRSDLFRKKIMPGMISLLKSPFKKKDGSLSRDELIRMSNRVSRAGILLQQSILNDVLSQKKDAVRLSPDTMNRRKELEEALKALDREKGRSAEKGADT